MECRDYEELIDDYADGALKGEARVRLVAHFNVCPACRALAADVERIRATAARLEQHEPPPIVWPAIVRELGLQRSRVAPVSAAWFRRGRRWPGLAVAAALVVVVGAAMWWPKTNVTQDRHQTGGQATAPAGGTANVDPNALVQSIDAELRQAEEHYERAIAGLEQVRQQQQGVLDSQVAAALQKNLEVIDLAIAESRTALRSQPESQVAQETLFEAFRRKVALLQDTIALINEMRKGDPTGAARVAEGLTK